MLRYWRGGNDCDWHGVVQQVIGSCSDLYLGIYVDRHGEVSRIYCSQRRSRKNWVGVRYMCERDGGGGKLSNSGAVKMNE